MLKSIVLASCILVSAEAFAAPAYKVAAEIKGADGGWDLLSVDAASERLYIARRDRVTAVDLARGTLTDKLAGVDGGHAALAIPGSGNVLVTSGNANQAIIMDGRTGQVRATIPTGKKPDAAAYDPATKTVWVMTPGDGAITVVDPKAGKAVATVPVGGSLELGAADGYGKLYVNVEDRNEVAVLDTRSKKVLRRDPLPGCDGPTGIIYDPSTKETVSACANGIAVVLSATGKPVASIPVGKRPDGAAFDERRHLALIPSGGDGNLSIIQLSPTPRLIATLATAKSARTIALDPATGRAYLPATDLKPAAGNARPQAVPGTFRVLVVAPGA
ncbi:MAG TPA: YncE family protein [Sphingomicrobium sp.]|nr:YncE family protein [Sphingomicrobium sp.]